MAACPVAAAKRPAFLITIDTEGDNAWAKPRVAETRNAGYLARFQAVCEKHSFKPTYLTNYEMASSPEFQEFGRDALRRGTAEIGMHLHAWNSPPLVPLTADDLETLPYLIEYPTPVIREKVAQMTGLLEETFGVKMTSHRAGRWSFNAVYARILAEHGYQVDCSVTPLVSWQVHRGDPAGHGGVDFSRYPSGPYYLDLEDISRPGDSGLLELPMTIVSFQPEWAAAFERRLPERSLPARALRRAFPPAVWLRPAGGNLDAMRRVLTKVLRQERPYAEFMLHSSEFMPGGSPTFPDEASIERLYDDVEALFETAARDFAGATLSEFSAAWRS